MVEKEIEKEKVIASEEVKENIVEPVVEIKEESKTEQVEEGGLEVVAGKNTWIAKTELGRKVLAGEITDIDTILDSGKLILESNIVDYLLPGLETDLLLVGQAKGKFGGGQRRAFKQTQKKTSEGNKLHFAAMAIVGNRNGYVGIGYGKAKETVPAREKAIRNAKLNIFKIRRGAGTWESDSKDPTSIPFKVTGKNGAAQITLIPAPKGTGLVIEKECSKILRLAGIQDIRSMVKQPKTKINIIKACVEALKKLSQVKIRQIDKENLSIVSGSNLS